jgi:ATP-dependent helicase/nuclease subunit A
LPTRKPSETSSSPLAFARPYGDYGKIVNWRIEESLPDAVGAFIDWLTNESGWTIEEDDKQIAVKPRHICILFRRFRSFSTDMTPMSALLSDDAFPTCW